MASGVRARPAQRALGVQRVARHPWRLLAYPLILGGVVVIAAPLWWMLTASFMAQEQIFNGAVALWPRPWTLDNYASITRFIPVYRNLLNSFIISGGHTVLSVFFASLAGYAFAKLQFPGRQALFVLILVTMMVPPEVGLIPAFVIMSALHLVNTYWSLILPGAASGLGIFFMRQYIAGLPSAILEAARIDGCSELGIYAWVVAPLSVPALAAWAILAFIGSWNDYLWPLVMLRTPEMQTITLAVPSMQAAGFNIPWGAIMAGSVVAVLPLLVVFLTCQRYFVAGITLGGVKE